MFHTCCTVSCGQNVGPPRISAGAIAETSSPPRFAFRHVLAQPVLVDLQAQSGAVWVLHDALADHWRFTGSHLLLESAELAEHVLDLEEILDRARELDRGIEPDERARS